MLEMRPDCEICGRDLPADSNDAHICSFECTYCLACAERELKGVCRNCGGNLRLRPTREARWLEKHPAATERRGRR